MAARICRQNHLRAKDRVGGLADLTAHIRTAGVNIRAMCAWSQEGEGHMMLVADDAAKACAAVRDHVIECRFDEVICMSLPSIPGALNEVAQKIAQAGIAIELLYATDCDCKDCDCQTVTVVMGTTDNAKVLELLGE